MQQLPPSEHVSTAEITRIFSHTTATYKFYWFIGLLDLLARKGRTRMDVWDIMIEMVANAWYPVCYFQLSFGKTESLFDAIMLLQRTRHIPLNISPRELSEWLHDNLNDPFVTDTFGFLMNNVPYRFLSPWINTPNNNEMMRRSQSLENDCLYSLTRDERTMWLDINVKWVDYLLTNYHVLKDYAYWNLTLFLQVRNPNVPNIPFKLIKPEVRNALSKQRHYWDFVISHAPEMRCIYTGRPLADGRYDLDHFIPWSFVTHDLVWNLIPADSSVNASKSNRLPPLEIFLPRLAAMQQKAVKISLIRGYTKSVLEDYLYMGCSLQELADMDSGRLLECFQRIYQPLVQIALNTGFAMWDPPQPQDS